MNRTFKREQQQNPNTYNMNTTKPIITKLSQGIATTNEPLWVVPRLPPINPRWRTAAILNFVK